MTSQAYLPFRGLSGWFSCSVNPTVIQLWDYYGGALVGEDEANYLFSDDASSKDTMRVYETQQDVAMFQSSWIHKVTQNSCTVHDVPLGQYLLLPHCLTPRETDSPQLTSMDVASHTTLTNDGTQWGDSRKSHHQGNKHGSSSTHGEEKVARRAADNNPLTERASAMFAEYNATWDELERRLSNTDLKDIADVEQVPCVVNTSLMDFVVSQPEFKIRRV